LIKLIQEHGVDVAADSERSAISTIQFKTLFEVGDDDSCFFAARYDVDAVLVLVLVAMMGVSDCWLHCRWHG
jgi:hypothetical protein